MCFNMIYNCIPRHTTSLATYLRNMLLALRHEDGDSVCTIYGLDSKVRYHNIQISYMSARSNTPVCLAIFFANLYVNVRFQCFLNLRLESGGSRLILLLKNIFRYTCLLLGVEQILNY